MTFGIYQDFFYVFVLVAPPAHVSTVASDNRGSVVPGARRGPGGRQADDALALDLLVDPARNGRIERLEASRDERTYDGYPDRRAHDQFLGGNCTHSAHQSCADYLGDRPLRVLLHDLFLLIGSGSEFRWVEKVLA